MVAKFVPKANVQVTAKKLTLSDHEVKTQENQAVVQNNPLAL